MTIETGNRLPPVDADYSENRQNLERVMFYETESLRMGHNNSSKRIIGFIHNFQDCLGNRLDQLAERFNALKKDLGAHYAEPTAVVIENVSGEQLWDYEFNQFNSGDIFPIPELGKEVNLRLEPYRIDITAQDGKSAIYLNYGPSEYYRENPTIHYWHEDKGTKYFMEDEPSTTRAIAIAEILFAVEMAIDQKLQAT